MRLFVVSVTLLLCSASDFPLDQSNLGNSKAGAQEALVNKGTKTVVANHANAKGTKNFEGGVDNSKEVSMTVPKGLKATVDGSGNAEAGQADATYDKATGKAVAAKGSRKVTGDVTGSKGDREVEGTYKNGQKYTATYDEASDKATFDNGRLTGAVVQDSATEFDISKNGNTVLKTEVDKRTRCLEITSQFGVQRVFSKLKSDPIYLCYDGGVKGDCAPDGQTVARPGDWEWSEPDFKIHTDDLEIKPSLADQYKSNGEVNYQWPDCFEVSVPVTIPQGERIDNLAVSADILTPGGQLKCGRDKKATKQCFYDDLCTFKTSGKTGIAPAMFDETTNSACEDPTVSSREIDFKVWFCPNEDHGLQKNRIQDTLSPTLINANRNGDLEVVIRLWKKKEAGGGFASALSRLQGGFTGLFDAIKKEYNNVGCQTLEIHYTIKVFNYDFAQSLGCQLKSGFDKLACRKGPAITSTSQNTKVDKAPSVKKGTLTEDGTGEGKPAPPVRPERPSRPQPQPSKPQPPKPDPVEEESEETAPVPTRQETLEQKRQALLARFKSRGLGG